MTEHYLTLLVGFALGIVCAVDIAGMIIIFKERKDGRIESNKEG